MKNILLSAILLLICLLFPSKSFSQTNEKVFNFGATIGFSSSLPVINSITIDDLEMENVQIKYKVGYTASAFLRINFDRFFMQPSLSWVHSKNEYHFSYPTSTPSATPKRIRADHQPHQLNISIRSLEVPVLIGYNIVKQDGYALSLMAGPTFKYNYHVSYSSVYKESALEFESDNTPYGISIATGVSVTIWRLFFDFIYEFGLNQVESEFKSRKENSPLPNSKLSIDKHSNVMSFSLGFLF